MNYTFIIVYFPSTNLRNRVWYFLCPRAPDDPFRQALRSTLLAEMSPTLGVEGEVAS